MEQILIHANVILEDHIQPDSYVKFDTETGIITGYGAMDETLEHLPATIDCNGY